MSLRFLPPVQPLSPSQALQQLLLIGVEDKAHYLPTAHLCVISIFRTADGLGLHPSSVSTTARESKDRQETNKVTVGREKGKKKEKTGFKRYR